MAEVKNRKQIAAEETQRAIVEAAARLFLEQGYHATTIGRIASEAGVAVQTIYNSLGSKRDVLSRVLDVAAAGPGAPARVPEMMRQRTAAEPNPRRLIGLLVELWRGTLPRTAPIFRIIREAAASDPEIAALESTRIAQRLANYREAATAIEERGALRAGVGIAEAAATIFAIGHPETFRALVVEGAWEIDEWTAWVQTTLEAALLAGDS